MSDLHIPFHSDEALEAAIKYCMEYNPDTIIINGDLVDHYNLSEFLKNPKVKDFEHERKCVLQFLGYLRERFPYARIIWKEGNHEHWYFRYMMKTNGALMKLKYFQIENVYRTKEFKIEYVDDNRPIAIKDLWILHGHELQKQSIGVPVNPARSVYLKAATTMLVGHHHITSEHTTQNAKGNITTTWSVGCLSHLRPPYARFSKYNNGFAIIEADDKTNYFQVFNKKIYKGKVI
jgi:metallophosphoesterase superfamily enzyme